MMLKTNVCNPCLIVYMIGLYTTVRWKCVVIKSCRRRAVYEYCFGAINDKARQTTPRNTSFHYFIPVKLDTY